MLYLILTSKDTDTVYCLHWSRQSGYDQRCVLFRNNELALCNDLLARLKSLNKKVLAFLKPVLKTFQVAPNTFFKYRASS